MPRLFGYWNDSVMIFELQGRMDIGRDDGYNHPAIGIPVMSVSRVHAVIEDTGEGTVITDMGSSNGTVINGQHAVPHVPYLLNDGDIIRISNHTDIQNEVLLIYSVSYISEAKWNSQSLGPEIRELEAGRDASILLSDPMVSKHHARFIKTGNEWIIADCGSTNGTFLNNIAINTTAGLRPLDVVRIAKYYFIFTGQKLYFQSDNSIRRIVDGGGGPGLEIDIERRTAWRKMKKYTLLRDIHLSINTGSMVLILGGSGAGKTTFMNAVMGYEPAEGSILYKGTDIYTDFDRMKYEIGYVPQQDLLRMNDTVYSTLRNAAEMRLPEGLSDEDYEESVRETMHMLGLEREEDSLVGKLSGGQRKRLSIAVEYIGGPSLFFLDEPDSGLDGTMARSLMENLRSIADTGKIVMVISHSPDRAFELFDQVIILAKGSDDSGHLVFTGSPRKALEFFDVDCLEAVVRRINRTDEGGEGLADEYIEKFNQ